MPYENEHAARIKDPDLFKDGDKNWGSKDIAPGIRIILGKLKSNGEWETQAYRFNADKFSATEAKEWLKDHDIKYISFEPAKEEEKSRKMEREIRSLDPVNAEIRATRRGRMIEGYAIVFNKRSKDLGGFIEIIEPGAVDGVIERSDILALLNHDESRGILARSTNGEGTLELTVDNFGVKYRYEAPDTVLGDEVLSGVRRGDIRTSSFAFSAGREEEDQSWLHMEDGTYLRTIKRFESIYDVSAVYREAYADTTVAVRSLVEIKTADAERRAAEAIKKAADLEEELRRKSSSNPTEVAKANPAGQAEDLTEYFKKLESRIKKI